MAPRYPIDGVNYRSATEKQRHLASGAWLDMTAGDAIRSAAAAAPDKAAVIAEDGTYTFGELDTLSESLAAGLLQAGLRPGDRAVFQIGAVKEIFVALHACFKAGIVPLCTLPQYRDIEIGSLSARAGATAYFVQSDLSATFDQPAFARRMMQALPAIEHLIVTRGDARDAVSMEAMSAAYDAETARAIVRPHDPSPEDVILFQLSGGSTGLPKIIPRMHSEYLGSALALAKAYQLDENDVVLWALPLIHNAGMLFMVMPNAVQRRTTVIRSNFDVEKFLAAIARHRVTFTGSIGPVAPRIMEFGRIGEYDLSSLGQFFALSRSDALEAHVGIVSGNMFGITEGLLLASAPSAPPEARHRGVGKPTTAGDEVRLLQPGSDEEVPFGEVGELAFRGPSSLVGYFADPQANEACFTRDGFFRSGDLLRAFDVDGVTNYIFEGRIKDNINRGGEKIGAEELENLIASHPDVLDARVVAMPDKIYGEKVCAYIVPKPNRSAPSVKDLGEFLLKAGLAKYKLPERIESIAAFPVTRVGKVDKAAMRGDIARKLAEEETGRAHAAASAVTSRIAKPLKIAVVGGGPAGLLFAKLVARERPDYQIRVFEQNPADATYGFGIVLADAALEVIKSIDSDLYRDLVDCAEKQDTITIFHRKTAVPIRGNVFLGIPRVRLLNLMQSHATAHGVKIEYSKRIESLEDLSGYDLVVGADGVNSVVRDKLQHCFQAVAEQRINKWAWYGTRHRFDCVGLIFEQTPHGILVAHSYRYAPDFGTFVIECHPDTWKRAGLDTMSEDESRQYCGTIFKEYLDGNALISNRSTWFNPSFVTSRRWFCDNVVLIGDALKTVHPSIGSGTRMAYEDAIALAHAVNAGGGDVPASLASFEAMRRPAADGFQDAAMRSILWYETADTRQHLTPLEFAFSYMMRTGKVNYERLRKIDPDFLAAYEAEATARRNSTALSGADL